MSTHSNPILIISIRKFYIRDNLSDLYTAVVSEELWGDAERETGSCSFTDSGLFFGSWASHLCCGKHPLLSGSGRPEECVRDS